MTVPRGSRVISAARVAELYATGLNGIEIADAIGISRSYAYELLHDPDGAEATVRKGRAYGTCEGCGKPTSYTVGGPTRLCRSCTAASKKKWTHEAIVAAIQRYAMVSGKQPTATCWNTAASGFNAERARLFREGDYPVTNTVRNIFGSWNAAIEAAGFEPVPARGYRGLSDQAYERTIRLYEDGRSIAEIARAESVSVAAIKQRLERKGAYQYREPTRSDIMGASIKAEQVIDREIERAENRIERLREELTDAESIVLRLRAAREAMADPKLKAVA